MVQRLYRGAAAQTGEAARGTAFLSWLETPVSSSRSNEHMITLRRLCILATGLSAVGLCILAASCAGTRVSAGVGIGPAPICPYGYYEAPPYNCAPDGYYGPEWFSGGVFIGAGPWYRGPGNFYGHVDHAYDYRKGYRGGFPARGAVASANRVPFRGTAMHDPRGHEGPRR